MVFLLTRLPVTLTPSQVPDRLPLASSDRSRVLLPFSPRLLVQLPVHLPARDTVSAALTRVVTASTRNAPATYRNRFMDAPSRLCGQTLPGLNHPPCGRLREPLSRTLRHRK